MYVERMNDNIDYIVGDIRDKQRLMKYLKDVDYILHAAALKHVPTGENFPDEVIKTNILGTQNVIDAAEECGIKKIVNLSTDKAVYPINAYGMSKALAEKQISAHNGDTVCVNLRYGNVLISSVVNNVSSIFSPGRIPITFFSNCLSKCNSNASTSVRTLQAGGLITKRSPLSPESRHLSAKDTASVRGNRNRVIS